MHSPGLQDARSDGWVLRTHALHGKVSGFDAVRQALRSGADPTEAVLERSGALPHVTGSTGAGGLIRMVSAGFVVPPEVALLVGAVGAAYTHDGATGYLSAGTFGHLVASLIAGADLPRARGAVLDELRRWPDSGATRAALADPGVEPPHEVTSAKALRMGLSMADARQGEPIAAIAGAAAYGGTAASVVAGAVVGALRGATAFPAPWCASSPAADVIESLADALALVHRAYVMGRPPAVPHELEDQVSDAGPAGLYLRVYQGW